MSHKSLKTEQEEKTVKQTLIGYGEKLPANLIETLNIEGHLERKDRLGVVTKGLIVVRVDTPTFVGKVKIGDNVTYVNGTKILRKTHFYELLHAIKKRSGGNLKLTIQRPIWCSPTESLPKGYDKAPGYKYFTGVLFLYAGGKLGMNIKTFANKVYVSDVEQDTVGAQSCLIGDCIVAVDDEPVTTQNAFVERLKGGFARDKLVVLTLERPVDAQAISVVRIALLVEKTIPLDAPLAADTARIAAAEAKRISTKTVPTVGRSILREQKRGGKATTVKHAQLAVAIQSIHVGADPFNPIFMQAVPPRGMEQQLANTSDIGTVNKSGAAKTSWRPLTGSK